VASLGNRRFKLFEIFFEIAQCSCSSRNFSASSAAMQPEPAAVMAWR
jgi:hypothetical protein